jgi:hypothetical protein
LDFRESQTGFIAQELEKVFPHLVKDEILQPAEGRASQSSKGANYIGLVPILTKALQEQNEEIEKLKEELKAHKEEPKLYQDRLAKLEKVMGLEER